MNAKRAAPDGRPFALAVEALAPAARYEQPEVAPQLVHA
jgi:hypothetical protein